jgi:hypothetical protein
VKRVAAAAGGLFLLLVVAQFVLPAIAERIVRGQLDDRGKVESVDISAFPAVKLIFHKADSVRVHMSSLELGAGDIGEQIEDTRDAAEVDARIDSASLGPLQLHDLEFHKRGDDLAGEASVTTEDLQAALPFDLEVAPVASGDGALTMEVAFGPVAGRARLSALDGSLQIAPDGLLGGFAALTIFEDPRVVVTGVGARGLADGFTLTADGELP